MRRNVWTCLLLMTFLSGCLGPIDTPAPNKVARKVVVAVIEDSFKRTKDSPQADSAFWKSLGTEFQLIDQKNARASRFKVQTDRLGIPALVIYDATTGQVLRSAKLPEKTAEIKAILQGVK